MRGCNGRGTSSDLPRRLIALGAALDLILSLGLASALPGATAAAEPSPSTGPAPTARPPTCAERYRVDGPGGLDLLLGCVVADLVTAYTRAGVEANGEPPRISAWLAPIALTVLIFTGLALLLRLVLRRLGREFAPAAPTAWWSCPGCHSLNAAGHEVCYACGRARDAEAPATDPDAEPFAPQSFGRRMDR